MSDPEDSQKLVEKIETLEVEIVCLEQSNNRLQKDKLSLQSNEAKVLDIQRLASIYSWEVNLASWRLKGSEQLLKILGKDSTMSLAIEDLFKVIHTDDVGSFEKLYDDSVGKDTPFEFIHRITLPNGEERIVNHYCKTFFSDNGTPLKSMGLMQDITALKQTEDKLKSATAKAKAADQAKSEFLANMSHELRTPLNGILGYAQILARSQTLADRDRDGVDIIHQCGTHLLTLINDVLDLSKIEARKLELIPTALHLPALLQSVVEMCKIKADQKGVDFFYRPSSRLPCSIEADEKRLRQVLINLLGNAIKFTDAGSVILQVDVLSQSEGQAQILFQIIDTGVGIVSNDLAKLFEAFEQVGDQQQQSEGTGLGLAISQRIVQLMGGTIEVKSQLGVGSEFFFCVEVPLAKEWVQQQSKNRHDYITGYEGDQSYSILVVDDRTENRAVLSNLLKPLGFTILEAENGQSALEILQTQSPDLVITDLAMPVMNGFEFLRHIRSTKEIQDTKVLVSSASVSQVDQQTALDHGGNDFLPKPVDLSVLLSLLADHFSLEWTYKLPQDSPGREEPSSTSLVIPPRPILEALLMLAERNLVLKLRTRLEALKESDSSYSLFSESLLELAQQFQFEEIESLLQQHLKRDLTHV